MTKLLATLALVLAACVSQTRVRPAEPADPAVGDMRCAPPMSIHSLLHPDEADDDGATCAPP
jgi:hypothetical protein